jgi:glycerate kinase
VVVGLGGTGTNDGGAGLLAALGATASPADALGRGPAGLAALEEVDLSAARERLGGVELIAASDVDNPLLGLRGATKTYGPQKGVTEERLMWVEGALERLVDATDRRTSLIPGAGAAGGLGFGMLAFFGAELRPGVDIVLDAVNLRRRLAGADLCITGEGRLDAQSLAGKAPIGVARLCKQLGIPCVAIVGAKGEGADAALDQGVTQILPLQDGSVSADESMRSAARLIRGVVATFLGRTEPGKT